MMPLRFNSGPEAWLGEGTTTLEVKKFLGTDELVLHLRALIPGGIAKRTVYQWCDQGCPHIQMPGAKRKLLFVLAEVMDWVISHRGESAVPMGKRRMA